MKWIVGFLLAAIVGFSVSFGFLVYSGLSAVSEQGLEGVVDRVWHGPKRP